MDLTTMQNVANPFPGAPIYHLKTASSTMDVARSLFDATTVHGTAVVADYQKKGRGRFNERAWVSERGKNLLVTLVLRSGSVPCPPARLPLLIGLALSLAIEHLHHIQTTVKWPNDILVKTKKIAGILCEGYNDAVLAGIGINCNQTRFPSGILMTATSLAVILGKEVAIGPLLETVLDHVREILSSPSWINTLNERLAYRGEEMKIVIGHPYTKNHRTFEGVIERIDEDGGLVVYDRRSGGNRTIVSGEIIDAIG